MVDVGLATMNTIQNIMTFGMPIIFVRLGMLNGYKNITVFIVLLGFAILASLTLFFNKNRSKIGPNNYQKIEEEDTNEGEVEKEA